MFVFLIFTSSFVPTITFELWQMAVVLFSNVQQQRQKSTVTQVTFCAYNSSNSESLTLCRSQMFEDYRYVDVIFYNFRFARECLEGK